MKLRIVLILSLAALMLSACMPGITINAGNGDTIVGSGNLQTESRDVSGITSVRLEGQGDVEITVGDSEGLTIEAEDNLLPLLISEVRGGVLVLRTRENTTIQPKKPIRYAVTVKQLEGLELPGSGSMTVDGVQSGEFNIRLSGSGDINVANLEAGWLETRLNGSGTIRIDGAAGEQTIEMSGSGLYDAGDLKTADTTVRLPGSGDITVWASDNLEVSINGSGNVNYYGAPKTDTSVRGSGNIRNLGEKE
jgi:hypothetical protein